MELKRVSPDLARVLKSLGFNISTHRYYAPDDFDIDYHSMTVRKDIKDCVKAPELDLVKMWFWTTYQMWIEITLWGDGTGFACMIKEAKEHAEDGSTIVKAIKFVEVGLACSDPNIALEYGIIEGCKILTEQNKK